MAIKRATVEDLDRIAELFDLYRIFYQQESNIDGAYEFLNERLQREESVIFMVLDDSEPVGFVQLYPIFSSVRMKRAWLLNDLYVKESARGKGLGEGLLKESITFAKGTGACGLLLETAKENSNAQRLYEKIGFVKETNYFYYFSIK